jgi:hypothetical protein
MIKLSSVIVGYDPSLLAKVVKKPEKEGLGVRILDLIESKGAAGMTATQIKKALYEMAYPDRNDWDAKRYRGWWSDPLYGGMHSKHGDGLLKFYCTKSGKRWVRKPNVSHDYHPWLTMRVAGRWKTSYNTNTGFIMAQYGQGGTIP